MSQGSASRSIAVIGAGWAGLSAAWHLHQAGHRVTVFEMAPQAGGRARSAKIRLADKEIVLDNGQHMLIGAYQESLRLIRAAHRLPANAAIPGLTRIPLQVESARMSLRARGAGQTGLLSGVLTARGLRISTRLGIIALGLRLRLAGWTTPAGETVQTMLRRYGQNQEAIECFWLPLCVAALNTPIEKASAQVFVNVLHDSLFAGSGGSDYLLPCTDLGQIFSEKMAQSLAEEGVLFHFGSPVQALAKLANTQWQVSLRDTVANHDGVILATPPHGAARLLEPFAPDAARRLRDFYYEAIQTVYLAWPEHEAPKIPPLSRLDDDAINGMPAQWLFARQSQKGLALAAAIISAPPAGAATDNAQTARLVTAQLARQLGLSAALDARTINEKRATFSCVPERPLATCDAVDNIAIPAGLRLAGDYCWARYPSTLEGATLSGQAAAKCFR